MSKTKVVLEFFLPTTSLSRINDVVEPIRKGIEAARGAEFFMTYSGPFPDDTRGKSNEQQPRTDLGRAGDPGRDAADARARDDFQDDETGERGGSDAEPEQPKRGRGRPPGSGKRAEAPGKAAGRSDEGKRAEGGSGAREGSQRDEPRGTDEGAGEGRGSREGGARGAGRDRDAERRDPGQARVAPADDWDTPASDEGPDNNTEEGADWWAKTPGDEWPDHLMPEGRLDKAMMGTVLSQHFEQSGDRAKTLAVLKEATGETSLPNVHPDDYDKAARALLKDAARIQYGVKR